MEIVHQTPLRVRIKTDFINKNLDVNLFTSKVKLIEGVNNFSLNMKTKTFVVGFERGFKEKVLSELFSLDLNLYITDVACDCYEEENPHKFGMIKAGSVLAASYLMPGPVGKTLTTLSTMPLYAEGAKNLFEEGINSTVLEALAVGISTYRGDLVAANSTNLLLEMGEYIEHSTARESDDLLQELIKPNVEEVWVYENGEEIRRAFNELKVGDLVIVNAGDTIAIDGHITSGRGLVNQASMTGESAQVEKQRGDRVLSGTVLEEGRIQVWAEHVGAETATARVTEYIQSSLNEKSNLQEKANKLADKLVPMTLGLAGSAYLATNDLNRAASVLQADYSCALKLATPVAFKSTLQKLGHNGIMVKGAPVLENLSEIDTFVFDKTGTLTKGDLEVSEVISFSKQWSREKILNLAASAEEHYFHPVAQAVVEAARKSDFVHIHHDEVEFIVAHGVATEVEGKRVVIGSRHFLEDDEKIDFNGHTGLIDEKEREGKTLLYIGFGNELLGMIILKDEVRSNAKAMVTELKNLGVSSIVMLTGDKEDRALEIAAEVGIDEVYFDLKPTEKADIVKDIVKCGRKVAFVGDGINDAPALVSSHVGISMAKGADLAKASADISLLKDDIEAIVEVKRMANETIKLVDRNFKVTVGANSAILLGATLGKLSPVMTSLLHNGTTVGLLLNSIRGVK